MIKFKYNLLKITALCTLNLFAIQIFAQCAPNTHRILDYKKANPCPKTTFELINKDEDKGGPLYFITFTQNEAKNLRKKPLITLNAKSVYSDTSHHNEKANGTWIYMYNNAADHKANHTPSYKWFITPNEKMYLTWDKGHELRQQRGSTWGLSGKTASGLNIKGNVNNPDIQWRDPNY